MELGESPAAPDNYTKKSGRKALFMELYFDLREAEEIIALGSTVVLGRIQFAQCASGVVPQCKLILRFAQLRYRWLDVIEAHLRLSAINATPTSGIDPPQPCGKASAAGILAP